MYKRTRYISFILGLFGIIFCPYNLVGQNQQSEDTFIRTLLASELTEEDLNLLEKEGVLSDIELRDILSFPAFRDMLAAYNGFTEKEAGIKTNLILESIYSQNSGIDTANYLYQNLRLNTQFKVGAIPVSVNARLVTADWKIQNNLSGISLDFNPTTFLNQFQDQFIPKPPVLGINKDLIPDFKKDSRIIPNTQLIEKKEISAIASYWNPEELELIQKEMKFQLYQKIISHPKFVALLTQRDSSQANLKKLENKVTQDISDKKEVGKKASEKLQGILNQYHYQWEDRKTYYGDSLNNLRQKLESQALQIKQQKKPEELRAKILASKNIGLGKKILAATTKLAIGQSEINDSWYTAKYLPINGLHYAFDNNRVFAEIAIGRQQFQNQSSPIWSRGLFNPLKGGKIFYAKGGVSLTNKGQLEYTYLQIKNEQTLSSSFAFAPQSNAVFSLAGNGTISKNFQIKTSFSFSRTAWGQGDLSTTNTIQATNSAAEISFLGSIFSNLLELEAGYFYVGPNFITSGNPFLQNNQHGLVTKLSGKIGKKLAVQSELKIGETIDDAIFLGTQKNWQLLGTINWRPSENLSISGQVSPNTFKHFSTGQTTISNANFIYGCQVTFHKNIGTTQWLNNLGITNQQGQLTHLDTTRLNESNYLFFQQSLVFENGVQVSWMTMGGQQTVTEETGKQSIFFTQLNTSIQRNVWDGTLGIQLLKDAYVLNWYYGLNTFQKIKFNENWSIGLDASWQIPQKSKQETRQRFWGSISIHHQF